MKMVFQFFSFLTYFVLIEQGSTWLEDGGIHTKLMDLKINYIFPKAIVCFSFCMSVINTNRFSELQ